MFRQISVLDGQQDGFSTKFFMTLYLLSYLGSKPLECYKNENFQVVQQITEFYGKTIKRLVLPELQEKLSSLNLTIFNEHYRDQILLVNINTVYIRV